uniref:Uncharacterized protein n=1 Tax=Tetranychus urticae TaxID=32264 RepID=T1KII2_TETUR
MVNFYIKKLPPHIFLGIDFNRDGKEHLKKFCQHLLGPPLYALDGINIESVGEIRFGYYEVCYTQTA